MFDRAKLEAEKRKNAQAQNVDVAMRRLANEFVTETYKFDYGYQWTWLGVPIIQLPADIVAIQEIIYEMKPDLIIEAGVAWGGSIVLYGSILELIGKGRVVGIDRVLAKSSRDAIMSHAFSGRITLYEGSSTDPEIVMKVRSHVPDGGKVMVVLDSNHTHDHVLSELRLYGPLVTQNQFLVVSDTIVEDIDLPTDRQRPWGKGNNPKTAMYAYLNETKRFQMDEYYNAKLLTTYTPGGYLRCMSDTQKSLGK